MATYSTSGTATDYLDLLDRLETYLVSTAGWATNRDAMPPYQASGQPQLPGAREYQFTNPDNNMYMSIVVEEDVPNDTYAWAVRGQTGYGSTLDYLNQQGASPPTYLPLKDGSMRYWFFSTDRRVIVVVQVGSVYESLYMGFFLPYATDVEYPYPLLVAGSAGYFLRYSSTDDGAHRGFFDPAAAGGWLYHPGGTWDRVQNWDPAGNDDQSYVFTHPYADDMSDTINNIDGSYSCTPVELVTTYNGYNVLGVLENVYHISGYGGVSPEDTITVSDSFGSFTAFVLQDTFRSGVANYCCISGE